MKLFLVSLLTAVCLSAAHAEDATPATGATLIPLDQIWGFDIPGTKDVSQIDVTNSDRFTVINEIASSLSPPRGAPAPIDSAFIVVGTAKEALLQAHDIFLKKTEPATEFRSDNELTLVFYCRSVGQYLRISSVERLDQTITVKYRFVMQGSDMNSDPFALVSLGKLPVGTYQVQVTQLPGIDMKGATVSPIAELTERVSHGFTFTVTLQPSEAGFDAGSGGS